MPKVVVFCKFVLRCVYNTSFFCGTQSYLFIFKLISLFIFKRMNLSYFQVELVQFHDHGRMCRCFSPTCGLYHGSNVNKSMKSSAKNNFRANDRACRIRFYIFHFVPMAHRRARRITFLFEAKADAVVCLCSSK